MTQQCIYQILVHKLQQFRKYMLHINDSNLHDDFCLQMRSQTLHIILGQWWYF